MTIQPQSDSGIFQRACGVFLLLVLLTALVMLSGCGVLPWNAQNNAGITNVQMEGCDADEGIEGQLFCNIRILDGKEKTDIDVRVVRDLENNTVTAEYRAKNVEAFEGQAIRAEVEKMVAEAIKESLPGITETVIKSINPVE